VQTSAKASNLNQKWFQIWIQISRLIQIRIWTFAPKILIHYLVSVSHFAKCRENQPVTVWEMLINLLKSHFLQWWGKWKSDSESVSRIGSPSKVNQFFRSAISRSNHNTRFPWNQLITFAAILHTDRQTDRQNDRQTNLIA